MKPHAPIFLRFIERYIKVIKLNAVVVLIEYPTADARWAPRMRSSPGPPRVNITANADTQKILHFRLVVCNPLVDQSNAAVQAEPARCKWLLRFRRLLLRLRWRLLRGWLLLLCINRPQR